jgi:hypothetical protein
MDKHVMVMTLSDYKKQEKKLKKTIHTKVRESLTKEMRPADLESRQRIHDNLKAESKENKNAKTVAIDHANNIFTKLKMYRYIFLILKL